VIWTRLVLGLATLCAMAQGQQTIGRVALHDATVTGSLEVTAGEATLQGGASIVALDHTAELALSRGGWVEVCATSSLHVTSGAGDKAPLLFALDRGAMELKTIVGVRDAVITPDLRISAKSAGRLDLRIRVTNNGDTCVESRGAAAPAVEVVEQFGDGLYQIGPGQHVLFEHGSIREVVDRESSPCGCPPAPVMSLAETGVTVAPKDAARAGGQAAQKPEDHPFPVAQSQGLASTGVAQVPQAPSGQVHAQVSATMAYGAAGDATKAEANAANSVSEPRPPGTAIPGAGGGGSPGGSGSGNSGRGSTSRASAASKPSSGVPAVQLPQAVAPVEVTAPPPPAPPGVTDIAHRVGRFFKRIFGRR